MKVTFDDAGSEAWWATVARHGTPLISPAVAGHSQVTFLWRDPDGDASLSSVRRVWLNITGITDHHQQGLPLSLERVPETDVWQTSLTLSERWRGSYSLIPDSSQEEAPVKNAPMLIRRQWWQSKFPQAQPDPLNPLRSWQSARGHWVSPLHMPAAPPQTAWRQLDLSGKATFTPPFQPERQPSGDMTWLRWNGTGTGYDRDIAVLTTGDSNPGRRPLILLLDGHFWAEAMPVASPLLEMTQAGNLPEAIYVFIDSVSNAQRSRELPCNADFWLAVQRELLPRLRQRFVFSEEAQHTVVVGQSFGGLSALYAALNWPERFGCALSQSGSFWWPEREPDSCQTGTLQQQIEKGAGQGYQLRIAMDAGLHERIILDANRQLLPLLESAGHQIRYREIEGGHDALCWRGGIIDGLRWLWSD